MVRITGLVFATAHAIERVRDGLGANRHGIQADRAQERESVFVAEGPFMTPAILFVTTSLYGQPASNSETRFESMEACEDARMKLMTDAQISRDRAQATQVMRTPPSGDQPAKEPTPLPMVSAICRAE
jgi:hypothetical protein